MSSDELPAREAFETWLGDGYGPPNRTYGIPVVDALRQGFYAAWNLSRSIPAASPDVLASINAAYDQGWNDREAAPVVWTDAQIIEANVAYALGLDSGLDRHDAMRAALEAASREGK